MSPCALALTATTAAVPVPYYTNSRLCRTHLFLRLRLNLASHLCQVVAAVPLAGAHKEVEVAAHPVGEALAQQLVSF
jgi:hypothetical protein